MKRDVDWTINSYIDSIRALYQSKDEIILWARDHEDVINTAEPLAEVEAYVKRAVETVRSKKDIESMHTLDKALYEMEGVLGVLERAYQLEQSYQLEEVAV